VSLISHPKEITDLIVERQPHALNCRQSRHIDGQRLLTVGVHQPRGILHVHKVPVPATVHRSRRPVLCTPSRQRSRPWVHAADWSDTSLSLRYGTTFAEPFDNNADGSRKDSEKPSWA